MIVLPTSAAVSFRESLTTAVTATGVSAQGENLLEWMTMTGVKSPGAKAMHPGINRIFNVYFHFTKIKQDISIIKHYLVK